ncbi:MAG: ABC transporter substrate-binding protein [Acidimicrobiales bacterium]
MNARRLLLRGYGPLAGLLVVLLCLSFVVPSRPFRSGPSPLAALTNVNTGVAPTVPEIDPGTVDEVAGGEPSEAPVTEVSATVPSPGQIPATGPTATTARGGATPATRPGAAVAPGTAPTTAGQPPPGALPPVTTASNCAGGPLQDGNTAYSPPCLRWNRTDNGGATNRGVTGNEIVVAYRETEMSSGDSDRDSKFAQEAKKRGLTDTPEDRARSRDALLEYFNSRYELYGRKVRLVSYKGRGSTLKEFGGAGQEEANADALKVAQEIGAFADLSATTQPYLDALVRQKVVSFGGIHLPAENYQARAPYAWGQLIDCTTLLQGATDLISKRFTPGTPAARAGSAAMRSQPRTYGLLVPDDPVYSQCIDGARGRLKAAGVSFAKEIRYGLDFSKMQQEAPNIAAQLKQAGVTTVVLFTDPALPYFLTGAATQQDYWPEWLVTGTVLTDVDVVGQFYDQDQWQFAAGQSFLSDLYQGNESESYRAYKAIRSDEPAITRDLYYFPLLMLFIGLQMAGPNLTPETFQAGMFSYPPRNGSLGRWSFAPGDYTAVDDAREIYYDRNALSAFNGRAGRYITLHGGRRFRGASWPAGVAVPVPPPVAP